MQKIFVLDSSVLLHDPAAMFRFQDNTVIIPYVVLEELEQKKRLLDQVGLAARTAFRNLERLREYGQLSQGVSLEGGGLLRIELNHYSIDTLPIYSDITIPDNRILAVSLNLTHEEKKTVILVTKDFAMRVKADALGIYTQDYFNDKVEAEISSDILDIVIEDNQFSNLYDQGFYEVNGMLPPNSCVRGMLSDGTIVPLVANPLGNKLVFCKGINGIWDIFPRNLEQHWAMEMLLNPEIKLLNLMGPAGTGKTLLALASGLEQTIHLEKYVRILCARPVIPMGKDIGYLPGEKDDKVRPYMQPIYDNLDFLLRPKKEKDRERISNDRVVESAVDILKRKRQLDIEVLTYIRGRNIPNQFIIIDEAQNLSAHEIKTIITRAGQGTKIVLCGDPDQIDHPYLDKQSNGVAHVTASLKGQSFYGQVTLVRGERSELATAAANLL